MIPNTVPTTETIVLKMQNLSAQLIQRFKSSNAQIASDIVTNLYNFVRQEDDIPKPKGADINQSKRILNQCVRKIIENFFRDFVVPNLQRVYQSTENDFLNVLLNNWMFIKVFAMVFKFVLSKHHNHYLHAQEIKQDCASVANLVLDQVNKDVLVKFHDKIMRIIINTFERERNQENTEKQKIKEMIEIIQNCGLDKLSDVIPASFRTKTIEFKKYVLEKNEKVIYPATTPAKFFEEKYFKIISEECIQSYRKKNKQLPTQPSEYISEVIKIMKQEKERADFYFFDDKSKEDYLTFIERELVDKKILDILNQENGMQAFIHASSEKDLAGTYSLCKRRAKQTFEFLEKQLTTYFITAGKAISHLFLGSEKKDANLYIESMIALKRKFNEIVEVFFKKDIEFTKLRNRVCKDILRYEGDERQGVKKFEFVGARNLAQYANVKMRECAKLDAADKIEEVLNNIILIFQSLMSQDKFLSEHQITLSKRLLQPYNHKPNTDVQRILIRKLEQIVGPKDVSKHLGMLRDFDVSGDFEVKLNEKLDGKIRVQPYILQSEIWPDNEDVDIVFPNNLIVEKSKVESIYSVHSQGKFLIWKVNRGISQVEGKFGASVYKFTMNNLMMFILLHIAEGNGQSILYGSLKQRFKLKRIKSEEEGGSLFDGEFKLNLLTLVDAKLVLRTKGTEAEIGQGESFSINPSYVYVPAKQQGDKKATKLKAASILVTIQPSAKLKNDLKIGNINTNEIIKKQRQTIMNGAIVQLMKHYKVMQFDNLIAEMRNHRQLQNIELKLPEIKERIENLITNDYLERDEVERNKLTYKP